MIGRIVGKNIGEISFRFSYDKEVKIGEILVADDKEKNMLFFLRAVDIYYGQEGAEKWGIKTAGEMLLMDEYREEYELKEKNRRLFKICVCKPLGYVKEGRFYKPKILPSHFCPVRRAEKNDYSFLEKNMGEIEIGRLRSGERTVDVKVGLPGNLLPYHIGIFATTGMGKSNLMRVFAASAMKLGRYGILIIDPHGEYYEGSEGKGLKHHPMAEDNLVVYSPAPSQGMNMLRVSAHEIGASDLENIFSFSEAQKEAIYALQSRFGRGWLVELHERSVDELVNEFGKRIQDITFSVLKRRAERIMESEIVHRDATVTATSQVINDLLSGKVVLIETTGLYEYEELLVSVVMARKILNHNKNLFRNKEKFQKIPPVLISMEEAQRVLSNGIFAQIAREGRKFKVGLCAITQQPKLVKEELLSQFNTFFILGLADEGDRNIIKASAKQDISKLEKEIQTLEVGEGLITYPGAPFAIPVKIHWYDDYIEGMDEKSNAKNTMNEGMDEGFY